MAEAKIKISGDEGSLKEHLKMAEKMLNDFASKYTGALGEGFAQAAAAFAVGGIVSAGITALASLIENVLVNALQMVLDTIKAIVGYLKDAVVTADDFEKSWIRFNSVIETTANRTGMTRKELIGVAEELGKTGAFSAKQYRDAETSFIRMRIGGDMLIEGLKTARDMARLFGNDLSTEVSRVARTLEDPVKAMRILRTQGLLGTPTEELRIKQLQDAGQLLAAQELRLFTLQREIGKRIGEGFPLTLTEKWAHFLNTLQEASAAIGETLIPVLKALMEPLTEIGNIVKDLAISFRDIFKPMAVWFQDFARDSNIVTDSFKLLRDIMHDIVGSTSDWIGLFDILIKGFEEVANEVSLVLRGFQALYEVSKFTKNPLDPNAKWPWDILHDFEVRRERDERNAIQRQDMRRRRDEEEKAEGARAPEMNPFEPSGKNTLRGTFEGLEQFYNRISAAAAGDPIATEIEKLGDKLSLKADESKLIEQDQVDMLATIRDNTNKTNELIQAINPGLA